MQFPESWLRTLVNPPIATDELAHRLTMAGLEVEETAPAAPAFTGVVVAHIVEIAPHPDADKLRVCQVDDGSGERLQIVGEQRLAFSDVEEAAKALEERHGSPVGR